MEAEGATTQLYPPWKEAVQAFLKEEFAVGAVIPFSWFYEQFGLTPPDSTTLYEQAKRTQFEFRAQFDHFQMMLLEDYQIAIRNHIGEGYSIVPPNEQARWGLKHVVKDAKRALKKGAARITNVNIQQLTMPERAEQADCLARMASIAGFVKQQARLPKS